MKGIASFFYMESAETDVNPFIKYAMIDVDI